MAHDATKVPVKKETTVDQMPGTTPGRWPFDPIWRVLPLVVVPGAVDPSRIEGSLESGVLAVVPRKTADAVKRQRSVSSGPVK